MSRQALTRKARKQGVGVLEGQMVTHPCRFDHDTWWHIRGLAANARISVAEQVRRLCAKGLGERNGAEPEGHKRP